MLSDEPGGEPVLIEARRHGVEYSVDHQEDRFLILTNDGARNFRLVSAPVERAGREVWKAGVPERSGVRLNGMDVHTGHVVLGQRSDRLQRLQRHDPPTRRVAAAEPPGPRVAA